MNRISHVWHHFQKGLFPFVEEHIGELTDHQKRLVGILDMIEIERHVQQRWWSRGRPLKDRGNLAKAFVAKAVYQCKDTRMLIDLLHGSPSLRRICGWNRKSQIPSESTFSRAFSEFAEQELLGIVHEALLKKFGQDERIIGHISRDSTDIRGHEKPAPKKKVKKTKYRVGRPRKNEKRPPKEPLRIERQLNMSLQEMLDDLPKAADWGTKKKDGKYYHWPGFKLHVDWADGGIPTSCILTSASVYDNQAAIPLATMSSMRTTNLYDLMDGAYDSKLIKQHSRSLNHVPIIDSNGRGGKKIEMDPAKRVRYNERTTAERGFSLLKELYGVCNITVRGNAKVMTHLMFAIVALTAERLLALVT